MKKSHVWLSVIAVPLALSLGVWALATIRLQTELLPLLPQELPSVRGMSLFQSAFASAQDVTIVIEPPGNAVLADELGAKLRELPDVEATTILGGLHTGPMVKSVAWMIANLPPEKFAEFQSLFAPDKLDDRLQSARDELAGAINLSDAAMLPFDPLGLLGWLQRDAGMQIPVPDPSNVDASGVVVLAVHGRHELRTFEDCQRFVDAVNGVLNSTVANPAQRRAIMVTGRPAFVAETSRQMQRDMFLMLGVAMVLVAVAFWLFYRSVGALLGILMLQALAMLVGVAAARLLFGELNVLSIGFASILLGVGMDYCILVYHFHASGIADPDGKHWRLLRGAIWLSAVTTALSFAILYFSSFPGLQQLSVLIAVGLLATAFFATETEPLILKRTKPVAPGWLMRGSDAFAGFIEKHRQRIMGAFALSLVAVACLFPVLRRYKFYDSDLKRLRPSNSEAYRGLDTLLRTRQAKQMFEVIVTANDWPQLREKASALSQKLGVSAPMLMPDDNSLQTNRKNWQPGKQAAVRDAMVRAGFDESWSRTSTMLLSALDDWSRGTEQFQDARLFFSNVATLAGGGKFAMLRLPVEEHVVGNLWKTIAGVQPDALPANWSLLTEDLGHTARMNFRRLSLWMLAAVITLCWVAHRSAKLVALNLLGLVVSVLGLFVALFVTRQSMTLLSLMSVPLLLGLIIDISLHLVLAMEENHGDLRKTYRHMVGPVLLTGLTSMIGFGAPMATQQPSLQNFGMVMDLGILSAVGTGLVLLPAFYLMSHRRPHYSQILYRAFWFRMAERYVRTVGGGAARTTGMLMGWFYHVTHPHRTHVVRTNLSLLRAESMNGKLVGRTFTNYGRTLADYLLIGTLPKDKASALARERAGLEHLKEVLDDGKGALLVTVHLGLFEFGGLLMDEIGHPTIIVTLPEPTPALSEWRTQFRKRWGAETLEVGKDNFSFVEITRRLNNGRCVAMLIDRPYDGNWVLEDFPNGKVPFSTGPVWLSLLSGSPILAVTFVALPSGGYRAEAYPPIRPQWMPEGRDETVRYYTKQVAAIFRETICKHPDQWYQFADLSSRR